MGIVLKNTNEMIGIVQLHTKDILNNNCKIDTLLVINIIIMIMVKKR